ncbi:hypothetical protein, partial [Ureaplasma diversum]|uniref:hypothetical protein n=1 Tax=Ureaplasma diversum TaxID=42094 RepID=UPI00056F0AA4
ILGWMFHINANEIEKEYEQLLLENGIKEYELWRKIGFSDNQIQPTTNNKAKVDEILEQIKNLRTERHSLTSELFLENDTKNPEYDPENGNIPSQEEWWSKDPDTSTSNESNPKDKIPVEDNQRTTRAQTVYTQFTQQEIALNKLSELVSEQLTKLASQENSPQYLDTIESKALQILNSVNKSFSDEWDKADAFTKAKEDLSKLFYDTLKQPKQ